MISPNERDYYRNREMMERLRAAEAKDKVSARIHEQLACIYEKLVEFEEGRPALRLVVVGEDRSAGESSLD